MNMTDRGEETRRRIEEFIRANPGVNKLDLQQSVGIGWGTAIYNVDVLKRRGEIKAVKDRGHVRLFDSNLSDEEVKFFCAMKDAHAENIIGKLDETGRVQAYDVADELGVSRKAIRRTMLNMNKAGMLHRHGTSRVFFSLTERAKRFVRRKDRA